MLAAWLFFALHVQSAVACPAGLDVERQLAPLLADGAAARDLATITPAAGGAVSLSLADPGGQAIGERTLPAARTCEEQAKAVAVTLAVWEAQLHPEISLALDRLEPPPPARSDVPVVARVAPAPVVARSLEWSLGVAGTAGLQSSTWAPGARLELGLGPGGGWWRGRLSLVGVGSHQTALAPGTVSWRRGYVQLGAEGDAARGRRWALVVGAGALSGVAAISGDGFPMNRSTRSFELGGEARARVEVRLGTAGQVRPWVGGGVAMWARRQALDVEGAATSASLPRVEPAAALGVDFVW